MGVDQLDHYLHINQQLNALKLEFDPKSFIESPAPQMLEAVARHKLLVATNALFLCH